MEESAFGIVHKGFNKNESRLKAVADKTNDRGFRDEKSRFAFYRHNAGSYGKITAKYKNMNTAGFKTIDDMKQKGIRDSINLGRKSKEASKRVAETYRKENPSKGMRRGLYWTDMHTPAKLKTMRMISKGIPSGLPKTAKIGEKHGGYGFQRLLAHNRGKLQLKGGKTPRENARRMLHEYEAPRKNRTLP